MYGVCRLCRYSQPVTDWAALFGVFVAGLARSRDRAAVGRDAGETLALAERVRQQLAIALGIRAAQAALKKTGRPLYG
jgi:hypothetical protein